MSEISGVLITVRTSRQGAAMEMGKFSEDYIQEISSLSISPEDYALLNLTKDNKAILKSPFGEITVTCRPTEGPEGVFFLPLGPLANQLIGGETHGTGVPDFKEIPVTIIPA
ncbi:MAG: molybdopterin dinucleotide binding domain-containing protein [Eubacteriales bacterium]